jgi:hypothetical protein
MSQNPDDLEAVRTLVKALEPFEARDQERIIRWAREKLGLSAGTGTTEKTATGTIGPEQTGERRDSNQVRVSIKDFIRSKVPQSDNQLAATVAYYHRFTAPESERKQAITKEDIKDACRLASIDPPERPDQTLVNAHRAGLLDKGPEKGTYVINSVGENLVAMTLPVPTKTGVPKKGKTQPNKPKASKKGQTRSKK